MLERRKEMDNTKDTQQVDTPKCELKWEGDKFSIECEDAESADRVQKAAQENEIVIRIKTVKEENTAIKKG